MKNNPNFFARLLTKVASIFSSAAAMDNRPEDRRPAPNLTWAEGKTCEAATGQEGPSPQRQPYVPPIGLEWFMM